ncbi:hypothetical protein BX070DRAFT_265718 [Coemansia spiralis]|nr:hypothetical protein BX070DRAFT_265718 [Coemansia spiralis]
MASYYTSIGYETKEVLRLFLNLWILLLIPMLLGSNFFYSYQFDPYNGALFTLQTRGLNSMIYWAAQIGAAYLVSFLHDGESLSRCKRGIILLTLLMVLTNIM